MLYFKLFLFFECVLKGFYYYFFLIFDNYFINIEMCMNIYLMIFLKKLKKKFFCVKLLIFNNIFILLLLLDFI